MSDFRMQIVHKKDGQVVRWRAGKDPIETDLVEDLAQRVKRRNVGVLVSQSKVLTIIREEFAEVLMDLKRKV